MVGIIILCLLLLIVAVALFVSVMVNVRFYKIITKFEDNIDECLDQIDDQYNEITKIANKEFFMDTPEIRQLVNSIKSLRESVLLIAKKLTEF